MKTENNLELKKEAEERKLHRIAKVHNFLVLWQGSQTYMLYRCNLAPTTCK